MVLVIQMLGISFILVKGKTENTGSIHNLFLSLIYTISIYYYYLYYTIT